MKKKTFKTISCQKRKPSQGRERCLLLAQQPTNKRDIRHTASLLLILALSTSKGLGEATKPQTTKQLVNAQAAEQAVDKATKTQPIEQTPNEVEYTGKQQSDRSNDLEQRLGQQRPKRVELLLRVRHIADLLLGVVDGGDDRGGEFLEQVRELVFRGGRLACLLAALGLGGDAAVGVEAAEGAVAVVEDPRAFFDEGLDVVDEFFLVELVTRRAVGLLDVLRLMLVFV